MRGARVGSWLSEHAELIETAAEPEGQIPEEPKAEFRLRLRNLWKDPLSSTSETDASIAATETGKGPPSRSGRNPNDAPGWRTKTVISRPPGSVR